MFSSNRRPPDLVKRAAAIAAAEGWSVVHEHESEPAPDGTVAERVSVVVSGGALRAPARLIVSAGSAHDHGSPRIASIHVPRSLAQPAVRRMRGSAVSVRLVEHPSRGTLDDLLADGAGLTAGEAVTVLAAVARGVSDLHAAGRAHARLSPSDIGFRDDGCPVLTAIDDLCELDGQTMRDDLAAFVALAGTVCSAVAGECGAVVLAAATDRRHGSWEDVVFATLRSADPVAVRPAPRSLPEAGGAHPPGRSGRRDVLSRVERVLDVLGDRPVARAVASTRSWMAARPLVVAVAAAPLIVVLVVLAVLPGPAPTTG